MHPEVSDTRESFRIKGWGKQEEKGGKKKKQSSPLVVRRLVEKFLLVYKSPNTIIFFGKEGAGHVSRKGMRSLLFFSQNPEGEEAA
jgi:hypothetical protein